MRIVISALVASVLVAARPDSTHQEGPLSRVRWLAGCWELQRGQRTVVEIWSRPNGNMMIGASTSAAAGTVREFEHLRLTAEGDSVVYTALPSAQQQASFRGTASDSGFVVENLQHDFPQRIAYTRRGADSLVARIEGPGPNGTRSVSYAYRRAACGG
jgi:hypothetical protein